MKIGYRYIAGFTGLLLGGTAQAGSITCGDAIITDDQPDGQFTLQLHKYPRGSSGKGVEDRIAASLWRCAGHHHR